MDLVPAAPEVFIPFLGAPPPLQGCEQDTLHWCPCATASHVHANQLNVLSCQASTSEPVVRVLFSSAWPPRRLPAAIATRPLALCRTMDFTALMASPWDTALAGGGAWGWFLWLPADHHGGFALGGALAWSRCPAIPRAAELGCGAATPLASCQRGWLYTTLPPKGCCSCLSSSTSQSCLSKRAQRLIPLVCLLEKVCNGV